MKSFSFEFYPPKTDEGEANLRLVHAKLAEQTPEFFSVTFGAGGSTRDKTFDTVVEIQQQRHRRRAAFILRGFHQGQHSRNPEKLPGTRHLQDCCLTWRFAVRHDVGW